MKEILQKFIDSVPDYKEFLTVAELDESSKKLAQAYPDTVKIFEMGKTREGHPLYCLKIGDEATTPDVGIMYGCPHPNEPIGTMLLEHFTWELAKNKDLFDEIGYTWYIVKSWDLDATLLNENWFKGPFTITNYARNFYRPAGHKQVDWTFPIDYKDLHFHDPIPETVAMMKLIDEIKPKFVYSLHNAGFGGVYWYISKPMPEIYEQMHNAAHKQGIALNLGEPEMPYCKEYYPAVYAKTSVTDSYDYMEENGITDIGSKIKQGTCSADYAADVSDAFTLLTELPYFLDKRINNMEESDVLRKDVVAEKLEFGEKNTEQINAIVKKVEEFVDKESPFYTALAATVRSSSNAEATRKMIATNPDYQRKAKVSEEFSNSLVAKFYRLLSMGMLVRLHESELEKMHKNNENNPEKQKALEAGREESLAFFNDLALYLEENLDYSVQEIKKLVTIQLEAGLLSMDYVKKHY